MEGCKDECVPDLGVWTRYKQMTRTFTYLDIYIYIYLYVHQRPNTALNNGKCCREDPTDIGGPTDP
jgi:hypothetical protein